MISNDLKILNNLKLGSPDAFKELFDLYYLPLSTYALKYCDSFSLAEDIVQDLFVKIWDEKLYMNFENQIGPYLFKSIKNNALQASKQINKYHFVKIEEHVNNMIFDENLDIKYIEEEKKKLFAEIESLPTKCQEVFKAIVLDNLKYKEVALQLGISVNTVKTHYSRALKQLRHVIEIIILFLFI
jgi:RNA polymerase sigma-70 factor (family 1)